MAVSNLGYLALEVSDLARWENFAVDVLGLQAGRRDAGSLALRMDECAQRISLHQGASDDLVAAGWQIDDEEQLERFVARVRELGVNVHNGGRELAAARCVDRVYVCDDVTGGYRHEFFCAPQIASQPFRSSVLRGPGFVTGALGVGHFVGIARDYIASQRFATDVLGLRISDYVRQEVMPGFVLDIAFFHSQTGRHHSFATAQAPLPRRIEHLMIEVQDQDDVGLAYERCLQAGFRMQRTIGRHPNDRMFSFYVETPSGFGLEYGHGGIVIDDADWRVVSYDRISSWGHQPG